MSERAGVKVIVVMPARNAAKALEATVDGIPKAWVDELILVDDSSTDETVALARELPLEVVWHPHQVGYGGNQKTLGTRQVPVPPSRPRGQDDPHAGQGPPDQARATLPGQRGSFTAASNSPSSRSEDSGRPASAASMRLRCPNRLPSWGCEDEPGRSNSSAGPPARSARTQSEVVSSSVATGSSIRRN